MIANGRFVLHVLRFFLCCVGTGRIFLWGVGADHVYIEVHTPPRVCKYFMVTALIFFAKTQGTIVGNRKRTVQSYLTLFMRVRWLDDALTTS